jgi:branched-chain amino acid transport system ATP-binding protein
MLKINNIDVFYGKVQALFDVSLEINEHDIVSIIGANGAGKSTLLKSIVGLCKPRRGSIEFQGASISGIETQNIVRKGIVYVPEGREVFPQMSVHENLEMGAYYKNYSRFEMEKALVEAYDLFPCLKERSKQQAETLSGGEQQMLAVARGLMSDPKLIMFDEPSLGLAPILVDEVFEAIVSINKTRNIPVIIVEQNAYVAMTISSSTYVLEVGHVVQSGGSQELLNSPQIKRAYLGG